MFQNTNKQFMERFLRRILFGSLAPRTRKFLRTAGIAIISAIALVAIFHLARLAEHPVTEKVNNQNVLSSVIEDIGDIDALQEQPPQDLQDYESHYKDMSGKAIGKDKIDKSAVIVDLMIKAGPNAALHPSLGVPVSKDFMDKEVERINRQQQRFTRPANNIEIKKTLALVQRTVERDQKKLSRKELRLWSSEDVPLRVLLVTTWRSGSTFLGQVLQQHPAVYQHYEPFSQFGIRQVRSGKDAFQAHQLLHQLLDCRYNGLDAYLNYTRAHPQDMLGHNKRVFDACKKGPNRNVCFNSTFLSDSCKMFPIQLVKSVRLRLNLTQLFLNDATFNVKVIFLVRDPRAIMNSRYSSVSWCTNSPDCSSPEALCNDMKGDLKVAAAFEKLYPDRFNMLKYEELATNPEIEIKKLMDFLGMEYSEDIAKFVREHTQVNKNSPWSTQRKSTDRISMWKKQLPLQEIHNVQNSCESVLKTLDYEIMGQ